MTGYRTIPSSDPFENQLREQWYNTSGEDRVIVEEKLVKYLWDRACNIINEDRKRHPKAKRNQAVGSDPINGGGGRAGL
jgi:hypothetical protein